MDQEQQGIFDAAKTMHGGLMAMGCNASVLYDLEQVMALCRQGKIDEAKSILFSIQGRNPN